MITAIIISLILLTALWNGLVIQWYLTKDQRYSKYWHAVGFIIRGLLVLLIYLHTKDHLLTGITAFISWIPYNMIINICMKQPIFYIGRTSTIDKFIRKILGLI